MSDSGRYPGSPPALHRPDRKGLKSSPPERRVLDERSRIMQEVRGKKRGMELSEYISDMLAEEGAWIRDKQALGIPLQALMGQSSGMSMDVVFEPSRFADKDIVDADEGLTDDERLELLLFLEETCYRAAREDGKRLLALSSCCNCDYQMNCRNARSG
jgi:hypothetical protein